MHLNGISIVTSDMASAMGFWVACGLRQLDGGADAPHTTFVTEDGFKLMLDTAELIRSITPDWQVPNGGHRVAIALECASPEAVDEAYTRLLQCVGTTSVEAPYDAFWGQRYATVADPDGNPVDLYATL